LISANRARFPICLMARVLGVSKAGDYAWRHRPLSARARADEARLARIRTVYISSRQTSGAPRVPAELRAAAERHGGKRIARLMRAAGLLGAGRRRAVRSQPGAIGKLGPRRIWWTAISRQRDQTSCGSPISPASRPCVPTVCPDRGGVSLSGGRPGCLERQGCRLGDGATCEANWFWTPSIWPSASAGRAR
jgi:transposase InsO family protein